MAKNKLYWEKEKKRERMKEKRKIIKRKKKKMEKREEKVKEKERKVKTKGVGKQSEIKKKERKKTQNRTRKKQENTWEYLPILYTLSPLTSPGTGPCRWSSGGGACCADFQVLALGGAALPPAWCRAQWGLFTP